jgi:hypothetical protein
MDPTKTAGYATATLIRLSAASYLKAHSKG